MRWLVVRLPLLAMLVLAASLAASTLVAFELLQLVRFGELDRTLEREEERFVQTVSGIARQLTDAAGADAVTLAPVRAAADSYFRLNPPTDAYLVIVEIGAETLDSGGGLAGLIQTYERGELSEAVPGGRLQTVETSLGPVRYLAGLVLLNGQEVGRFTVLAPLQPIQAANLRVLLPMAASALISVVVGGVVMTTVLYRRLRPLRQLATSVRSVSATDPDARIPTPAHEDEISVLATEFNALLDRIADEVERRRQFLAAASHELRTPITIARGHIEILERLATTEPVRIMATAQVLREELQRMGRLVDDLLAVARSEGDDFVIRRPLHLGQFFDELRLRFTGLGVDGVELGAAPAGMLMADANRLAQAMLNLVVNASVHTPANTRIEVGARRMPQSVAFFVRDNGPGIEPELRERVFDPFVKGDAETHDSSGLGLAVVAAVVAAHGGNISLDTGPAGTTITLDIPAEPGPQERLSPGA